MTSAKPWLGPLDKRDRLAQAPLYTHFTVYTRLLVQADTCMYYGPLSDQALKQARDLRATKPNSRLCRRAGSKHQRDAACACKQYPHNMHHVQMGISRMCTEPPNTSVHLSTPPTDPVFNSLPFGWWYTHVPQVTLSETPQRWQNSH